MGGILDVNGIEGFLSEDRTGDTNDEAIGKRELVWRWWLHYADREASVRELLALGDELDLGFYRVGDSTSIFIQFKRFMNAATDTLCDGRKIIYTRTKNGMKHYKLKVVDKVRHEQGIADKSVDKQGSV